MLILCNTRYLAASKSYLKSPCHIPSQPIFKDVASLCEHLPYETIQAAPVSKFPSHNNMKEACWLEWPRWSHKGGAHSDRHSACKWQKWQEWTVIMHMQMNVAGMNNTHSMVSEWECCGDPCLPGLADMHPMPFYHYSTFLFLLQISLFNPLSN